MDTVRWGIAGTGVMARAMTEALQARTDAAVVAVASRDADRADSFAATMGIERSLPAYGALGAAANIDAVYIAATNDRHREATLACIAGGKAVLCEKPLGRNAVEAAEMAAAAREREVLLMEAMWMRFQPFLPRVEELLAADTIGTVRHLHADFCIPLPYAPDNRWFNPELAGGSLLDVGIYPLTLAYHLLGPPEATEAVADPAPTGVDAQIGVVSRHAGGALAVLTGSLVTDGSWEATISGTDGRLRLHAPFHHAPRITVHRRSEQIAENDTSYDVSGLQFEIDEFHACLAAGATESNRHPLDDSIAIAEWMTEIRRLCGIRYPGE